MPWNPFARRSLVPKRTPLLTRNPSEWSLAEVRDLVMPRVDAPNALTENPPISIPLVPGHLDVFIAIDQEDVIVLPPQSQLSQWHVRPEDLYPLAVEHLRQRSSPGKWRTSPQAPGVLVHATGDSYDSSRVLVLKDIVSPWPPKGVLVCVPARDLLLCVRLDEVRALKTVERMISIAKAAYTTERHRISDQLFWYDGETWETVPVEHTQSGVQVRVTERLTGAIEALAREKGPAQP